MWDSFGILFWLTVQIQFDVLYKWNALAGDAFLLQMTSFASWMPTFLSCSSEGPVEALLAFTSLKKLHRWASNAFLMRGLASEKLKSRRQYQNNQKKSKLVRRGARKKWQCANVSTAENLWYALYVSHSSSCRLPGSSQQLVLEENGTWSQIRFAAVNKNLVFPRILWWQSSASSSSFPVLSRRLQLDE